MKAQTVVREAQLEKMAAAHYEAYSKGMRQLLPGASAFRTPEFTPWEGLTEDMRKLGISAVRAALWKIGIGTVP